MGRLALRTRTWTSTSFMLWWSLMATVSRSRVLAQDVLPNATATYGLCYPAIVAGDLNQDEQLNADEEFLAFINAYGAALYPGQQCYEPVESVPTLLQAAYAGVACANCSPKPFCCLDSEINVQGAANEANRTSSQTKSLQNFCLVTRVLIGPNDTTTCVSADGFDDLGNVTDGFGNFSFPSDGYGNQSIPELGDDLWDENSTDLLGCIDNLIKADKNSDNQLTKQEFLILLQLQNNCTGNETELDFYQSSAFQALVTAQCLDSQGLLNCLAGDAVATNVSIAGAETKNRTDSDLARLRAVCTTVDGLNVLGCTSNNDNGDNSLVNQTDSKLEKCIGDLKIADKNGDFEITPEEFSVVLQLENNCSFLKESGLSVIEQGLYTSIVTLQCLGGNGDGSGCFSFLSGDNNDSKPISIKGAADSPRTVSDTKSLQTICDAVEGFSSLDCFLDSNVGNGTFGNGTIGNGIFGNETGGSGAGTGGGNSTSGGENCEEDIAKADANSDGFINSTEFYNFILLRGQKYCYKPPTEGQFTNDQKSTFQTTACLSCTALQQGLDCCGLPIDQRMIAVEYMAPTCVAIDYAMASMNACNGQSGGNTSTPEGNKTVVSGGNTTTQDKNTTSKPEPTSEAFTVTVTWMTAVMGLLLTFAFCGTV